LSNQTKLGSKCIPIAHHRLNLRLLAIFKGQKTWTKKTTLGDVYKLQSNSPRNNQKAEIHKDSGQFGIEFTLDKTINDFIHGAEKVDLDYIESFLEFENVLLGWYSTNWKQVLHEHFPEPVDAAVVSPEHDRSTAANFVISL
jgi:hypothetical protein